MALALGLSGGCDPESVDEPACTFHSEVEVADGEFIREPGNPWHHATFNSDAGDYVLEFHLDGMPAAQAIVDGEKLNLPAGVSVLDEVTLRFELQLSAGEHDISLRVAGPPGGRLRYRLLRVVASDQAEITDQFTVHQGVSSVHSLCGGLSSIAFGSDALQVEDQALEVSARCQAAACAEGGSGLASPRLVFDTPDNGYVFRRAPVLEHPTSSSSVRVLDGVPISSEAVGTVQLDGLTKQVHRSRIPHFSTVEDRDLTPWCTEQLSELDTSESLACYSSGDDPGIQHLAMCQSNQGVTTVGEVSACGLGPNACIDTGDPINYCSVDGSSCSEHAYAALDTEPCPPLIDDAYGSASHSLRCDPFTNQVFVGVENRATGDCELRGQSLITRDQQVKTVLAATYGSRFREAIQWYLATNFECATRDFAAEFVDYPLWADTWSTDILKFAICVDVLRGRGLPGQVEIAPQDRVWEAEMAAMMVRAGGVGPLALPDNTVLQPHPHAVQLHSRHSLLLAELVLPAVNMVNQACPDEAWFFTDPVAQAVIDQGVVCSVDALGWMTRDETAQWLHNLTSAGLACQQGVVSCESPDVFPEPQACGTCNSIQSCQQMINSLIELFPDYAARDIAVTYDTWGKSHCERIVNTIYCPTTWTNSGSVTNKLLFHELNHALREDFTDASGSCCICSNGGCHSGEFQASLLEGYYFPGPESECSGGHYRFTDTNQPANTRTVENVAALIRQAPAIPEAVLWNYAMGRDDTLTPYLERFEVTSTEDIYHSETYEW